METFLLILVFAICPIGFIVALVISYGNYAVGDIKKGDIACNVAGVFGVLMLLLLVGGGVLGWQIAEKRLSQEKEAFTPNYDTEKFSIVSRVCHEPNGETSIWLSDGSFFDINNASYLNVPRKVVHMLEKGDTIYYCACQNPSLSTITGVRPVQ